MPAGSIIPGTRAASTATLWKCNDADSISKMRARPSQLLLSGLEIDGDRVRLAVDNETYLRTPAVSRVHEHYQQLRRCTSNNLKSSQLYTMFGGRCRAASRLTFARASRQPELLRSGEYTTRSVRFS
jgi:hypothetical protein